MTSVRRLQNDEIGLFIPVQELEEAQRQQVRELAGEFLIRLYETEGLLSHRPLVVEIEDGTQAVFRFVPHRSLIDD